MTDNPAASVHETVAPVGSGAASHGKTDWRQVDWQAVRRNVRRLQARIVKATQGVTASNDMGVSRGLSRVRGNSPARF